MQYATLNDKKSMPSETGQRAECPGCGGKVLSK
jgi:DNA-directed RNA polymerase subunit RPC12/RpoP